MLAVQANSEPIPGPTTELLQGHCKRLGIAVAVGMNHLGMARMPNGKALNAYVVIESCRNAYDLILGKLATWLSTNLRFGCKSALCA